MITPDWSNREFLSSAVMNAAAGVVSGSFAQLGSGTVLPGLIRPEVLTLIGSGLSINVTAPSPFQIMFGNGVLAAASGITTGVTTQLYTASFSGLVPGSGSVTAYLLASYIQIMEGAYQVIGPPPGHPDYDPTFSPFTAYSTLNDSLNFTAATGVPDNITTFEVARVTLAAAATGVGNINTSFQQRSSGPNTTGTLLVSGTVPMSLAVHAGRSLAFVTSGTFTLADATLSNGVNVTISSETNGTVTLAGSGANLIYGINGVSSGVSSTSITSGSSVQVQAINSLWQIMGASPNFTVATVDVWQLAYMQGYIS